jgi:hypothetical protein
MAEIFSNDLHEALLTECAGARLRIDPNADVPKLCDTFKAEGHELELTPEGLEVKGQSVSVRDVLLAASRDEKLKSNFVLAGDSDNIRHLDQFSRDPAERRRQVAEYVTKHGADSYGKLCHDSQKAALRPDVTLSASMCREDYLNLTRLEKTRFIASLGSSAENVVGGIMKRRK